MEIEYLKSAARLMDRDYVNRGGLDLSKKELWVSAGQRAVELLAVKIGGKKKFCCSAQFGPNLPKPGQMAEFFQTSKLDGWLLCCPLAYRDPQYLFRKI